MRCLHCGEDSPEDEGIPQLYVDLGPDGRPLSRRGWIHRECQLRMVLGGPAHVLGLCSCPQGGVGCDPDMGLSKREAARVVAKWSRGE